MMVKSFCIGSLFFCIQALYAQTIITIGSGTGSPSVGINPGSGANACSPYGTNVGSGANGKKWQAIYTVDMINTAMSNAGLTPGPASFSTVGFNITRVVGSSYSHQGYTIKMANVAQADLSGGYYLGAMTTVYGPAAFTNNTQGWFSLNLINAFSWDGISNLCVEICYTGTTPFLITSYGGCQYTDVGGNVRMGFSGGSSSTTNCATPLPGVGSLTNRLTNMRLTATVSGSQPTITAGPVLPLSYCQGSNISVPYTVTGSFTGGNIFSLQLSDATGSFSSPTSIGTLTATGNGTVQGTIPLAQTPGNGYRVRVVSSNPAVTGTDNGQNIVISSGPASPVIQHKP
jgi:hypothetical protein